ncbi:DNA recombination and repair protein [Listeria phage LIS04]|nr:DNA recombination and repair protein [Listeria phage LIS04]
MEVLNLAKKTKTKEVEGIDVNDKSFDLVGLLDDLTKGSKFKRVSEVEMLHSRPKVPTPLPHLNAIFGGGIPFGVIAEGFGPPKAGKSTFWYETLAEFQKAFPNGIPVIVDTEMSVDDLRMQYMGIQTDKVLRLPALTLESGFEQVTALLKKKMSNPAARDLPVFIMWDTIAVAPSKAQHDEGRANAGGMSQKPRLIKQFLSDILVYIEEQPTILVLLNQVFTDFSGFRPKLVSGGGFGLKHDIQLQLQFQSSKSSFDGAGREIRQTSTIDLGKSKISPKFKDIKMTIDNTTGGTIDRIRSFMSYIRESTDIFNDNQGWIQLNPEYFDEGSHYLEYEPIIDKSSKKWRWDELVDTVKSDPNWVRFLQMLLVDEIAKHYKYYHDISRNYRRLLYLHLQRSIITKHFYSTLKSTYEIDNHLEVTEEHKSHMTDYELKVIEMLNSPLEDTSLVEELVKDKLEHEMEELEAEREEIARIQGSLGEDDLADTKSERLEYADGTEDLATSDDDEEE